MTYDELIAGLTTAKVFLVFSKTRLFLKGQLTPEIRKEYEQSIKAVEVAIKEARTNRPVKM